MAMGRKSGLEQQEGLWIARNELPRTMAHPFYEQVNRLLEKHAFDRFAEGECGRFYASKMGRPSLAPGIYFRLLLIGYFEGIDSERGIAWRCHDSRSLAEFLGVPVTEETPDHSSLSRIHGRLPLEVHEAMFVFVLKLAAEKKLLAG